jgi:hypothetical protein
VRSTLWAVPAKGSCPLFHALLNYEGRVDQCYVLLGEDGKPFVEAQQVLIENNLFLHHGTVRFWDTLLLKGGLRDIVFRANTVVGHPHIGWSGAYAAVFARIGENPPMSDLRFCQQYLVGRDGSNASFQRGARRVVRRRQLAGAEQ